VARRFNRRGASRLRLGVQLAAFGLLFYGGFAVSGLSASLAPAETQTGQTSTSPGKLNWVTQRAVAAHLFLPVTVCIYQQQGLCKGCSLYFLSDALTWTRPLETFVPFLLLLLLFMILFGRLWCGWICPLGLFSDLLTRLRARLGIDQVRLGRRTRDGLVVAKYVLLVLALGIAALAAFPAMADHRIDLMDPFCRVCPTRVFAPFFTFDRICWTAWNNPVTSVFTVIGLLLFALFFIGLTVRRFWCRLCPIGGLNTVFNRTGLASIVKDGGKCTRCGTCARVCPLDVRRVVDGRGRGEVTAYECTLCLRCVEACPEPGCLRFTWMGKTFYRS